MSGGATLEAAKQDAFDQSASAKAKGATGFEIRHLNAVDKVVSTANFNEREAEQ